jgi:hypothetical protein
MNLKILINCRFQNIFFSVIACWSSPCLNGGECQTTENNKYKCSCTPQYFGANCQSQVLNSTIFKNSTILTQEQSVSLLQVISPFPNIGFNLIYQASRDGFRLNDFHSKCDGILNTLMIIKTTDSYVFGGFTSRDWSQVSGFQADANAFLFSLMNSLNMTARMNVTNPYYALYKGPLLYNTNFANDFIGFGQNDIRLNDLSNSQPSFTRQVNISSYELPETTNGSFFIIAGNNSFFSSEIEVYSVNGKILLFFLKPKYLNNFIK